MTRRNDDRPLSRRLPQRQPRPSFLVVCEGKNTEPQYLAQFSVTVGNRLVTVEIVPGAGDPKAVVEAAIERMNEARKRAEQREDAFLAYDEVWCVFDVDDHSRLADALQQARDNDLGVSLSNPCFELWLLLHFVDQSAHISRQDALRQLRQHCKKYNKTVDFRLFANGYEAAVARAKVLATRRVAAADPRGNPSTDVFELTEKIREHGRKRA